MLRSFTRLIVLYWSRSRVLRLKLIALIREKFWRSLIKWHPFVYFIHHLFEWLGLSILIWSTKCFRNLRSIKICLITWRNGSCCIQFLLFIHILSRKKLVNLVLLFFDDFIQILFFLSYTSFYGTGGLILSLGCHHVVYFGVSSRLISLHILKIYINTYSAFFINLIWIFSKSKPLSLWRTLLIVNWLSVIIINVIIKLMAAVQEFFKSPLLSAAP